ncbi:cocosin 1-like [Curcuma longa]|uniref:cocosin 1-like n=1 Tax=Curcuma longa TaxID=136217 RepID=UPI003D9DF0A0
MANSIALLFLSLALCFLLPSPSLAQFGFGQQGFGQPWLSQRRLGYRSQCQLERLAALEPTRRVPSEAGFTEYFDQFHEQLQCAGVVAYRRTIQPRGLVLPYYSDAPRLVYIVQGRGISGTVIPGCPESFQSLRQGFEQQWEEEVESQSQQRFRDEHQRVQFFREGDVLAYPAGVANWVYNNGEVPIVAIAVADTSSNANQLDRQHRQFLLAGRERQSHEQIAQAEERFQQQKGNNLLSGFELELLAEAMGVDKEVVRKIQNLNDNRGDIVHVEKGLQMLEPQRHAEQEAQEQEREEREETTQERRWGSSCERSNGLEETYCTLKNRQNIANPTLADYYNPRAGRLTSLNVQKLPILRFIQLSAERGVLRRNAIQPPHWNINAHSIMYVVRGSGRLQVVGHQGRTVFDGELRQGQLLVIPQQHIVIKKAQSEQFEWISFKTNENALVSHIVGKTSVLRGIPVEVLMNSYRVSREEARRLKFNRGNEIAIFSPRQEREQQQGSVLNSVKELITGVFMA